MLGLEGPRLEKRVQRAGENRNPRTGGQLTPRTKDDRTVGYDFTWSVPKSVSLLYAMTEDEAVLAAFRESVHETMRDIEAEMKVRVRKNGRNEERVTGNLAYAEFVHLTSRPVDGVPDPQLHAHCFVFNATYDREEEAWKAGQFRDLKRDAPYFQAAFRARLANRLQALGYAIERKRDDFELAGVAGRCHPEILPPDGQDRGGGEEARHRGPGGEGPARRPDAGAQGQEPDLAGASGRVG